MLSIPGRTGHCTAPSELLSGPVRCCLYRAGQVILLRHPGFEVDRLVVVYTGPDRSFYCVIQAFKWVIAKIDRKCFKESCIDNTSSRFVAFSNLSLRLVIISL